MSDVSKEYGAAIFALAYEANELDCYLTALEKIKAVFVDQPEYEAFLSSPGIPMSERLNAIVAAFEDNTPEHVLSYLMLLCEKGNCMV
jgi:F0F1-type ATP synthase delta subunit